MIAASFSSLFLGVGFAYNPASWKLYMMVVPSCCFSFLIVVA